MLTPVEGNIIGLAEKYAETMRAVCVVVWVDGWQARSFMFVLSESWYASSKDRFVWPVRDSCWNVVTTSLSENWLLSVSLTKRSSPILFKIKIPPSCFAMHV